MIGPFKVIGIAGPARAGKDTAADYLASSLTLRKTSFADPIKSMLRVIGLSEEQLYGNEVREQVDSSYECTPRHMMQTLGTEWGRNCIHPDIWVRAMYRQLTDPDLLRASHILGVVIPDIRFENEAAFIREHGTLIHIWRDRRPAISTEGHRSEDGVEVVGGDKVLVNSGTPLDLYASLDRLDL